MNTAARSVKKAGLLKPFNSRLLIFVAFASGLGFLVYELVYIRGEHPCRPIDLEFAWFYVLLGASLVLSGFGGASLEINHPGSGFRTTAVGALALFLLSIAYFFGINPELIQEAAKSCGQCKDCTANLVSYGSACWGANCEHKTRHWVAVDGGVSTISNGDSLKRAHTDNAAHPFYPESSLGLAYLKKQPGTRQLYMCIAKDPMDPSQDQFFPSIDCSRESPRATSEPVGGFIYDLEAALPKGVAVKKLYRCSDETHMYAATECNEQKDNDIPLGYLLQPDNAGADSH